MKQLFEEITRAQEEPLEGTRAAAGYTHSHHHGHHALFDFTAQNSDEISFKTGDLSAAVKPPVSALVIGLGDFLDITGELNGWFVGM